MKKMPYGEYHLHLNYTDLDSLDDTIILFIIVDDEFLYLRDSRAKFQDVEKMPEYIQSDWIKYNSKPVTEDIVNSMIALCESRKYKSEKIFELQTENIKLLKVIQRDLNLKKLL
jgi:hypothetical protein